MTLVKIPHEIEVLYRLVSLNSGKYFKWLDSDVVMKYSQYLSLWGLSPTGPNLGHKRHMIDTIKETRSQRGGYFAPIIIFLHGRGKSLVF